MTFHANISIHKIDSTYFMISPYVGMLSSLQTTHTFFNSNIAIKISEILTVYPNITLARIQYSECFQYILWYR